MIELRVLQDDKVVSSGSIIRLYEVERFDIIKTSSDRVDSNKKEMDFYDFILVDCSVIKDNTFCLVNMTKNSTNRGAILCEFEGVDFNKSMIALHLKRYFVSNKNVFIELNE